MKKFYITAVCVVLSLATSLAVSASDNLSGVYKLSGLTAETEAQLGSISADDPIYIYPGTTADSYYVSGFAGFGCQIPATLADGVLTLNMSTSDVTINPYFYNFTSADMTYMRVVSGNLQSLTFTVSEGALTFGETLSVSETIMDYMNEEMPMVENQLGAYAQGLTLVKQAAPTFTAADLAGEYTFTAAERSSASDGFATDFTMTVASVSGNDLELTGFMGIEEAVPATYIPEVGLVKIASDTQISVSGVSSTFAANSGLTDIYFRVSESSLSLMNAAYLSQIVEDPMWGPMPMAVVILAGGEAVKAGSGVVETAAEEMPVSVYAYDGVVYVKSNTPVAVQVYNAAGVLVYENAALSSPIENLAQGIYFVKVAGNSKAVPVIL